MNLFGSSKPLTEDAKIKAADELRKRLATNGSGPSVEVQLRQGGEPGLLADGLDDDTLFRWLRAEDFNVSKAEARLRSHAAWRSSYVPQGRILEVRTLWALLTSTICFFCI